MEQKRRNRYLIIGMLLSLILIVVFGHNIDNAEDKIVQLNDQWHYFNGMTLEPNDITESRMEDAKVIELPDYFKKNLFSDLKPIEKKGTLYKQVILNEQYVGEVLGIHVPYFPRMYTVYINGEALEDSYSDVLTPHTLYFVIDQKEMEILIQFKYSNMDFWVGSGITIGNASEMESETFEKDVLNLALVISVIILLIYHSFFYAKNQLEGQIWNIILLSGIILFKSLTFSQNDIFQLFDILPHNTYNRLIYISIYTYFPALILMINSLQPSRIRKQVIDLSVYYLIANFIIVLLAPFTIVAVLIYPSVIYVSYVAIDIIRSLLKTYKRTLNKMIFMVGFFLVFLLVIYVFELLFFSNLIVYKYHILIGLVLFIVLEASYMFYTYNEAFDELMELEELNKDMNIRFNAFNRDYQTLLRQQNISDDSFKERFESLENQLEVFLKGLDHVYFYVDRELTISKLHSSKAQGIFGELKHGIRVVDVLFANNMDDKLYFETVSKKIFNSGNENETQLFINLLPKEIFIKDRYYESTFTVINEGRQKFIYIKLLDQSKNPSSCDVDKSETEALRMTVSVMSNIEDFNFYMEEYDKFCSVDIYRIMSQNLDLKQTIYELLRHIHSYKSVFSRFSMQMTVKLLHSIETEILEILEDVELLSFTEFKEILLGYDLFGFLEKDMATIEAYSGYNLLDEKHIVKVEKKKIDQVISNIHQLNKTSNLDSLLIDVKRLKYIRLNKLFSATKKYIYSLADKKETVIESIVIDIEPIEVDGRTFGSFVKSLNHVISNILEHGIESPQERESLGKTRGGNISIEGYTEENTLILTIEDDGRGIDINAMKDKLFKENKMSFNELLGAKESVILSKIFDEGFSSKGAVNERSGRGLGLFDVKRELASLNGEVEVSTKVDEYTCFEFRIPLGDRL